MRPVPFPEPYRSLLKHEGAVFRLWGAPAGHESEVAPTEAATYRVAVEDRAGFVHRDDQVVTSVILELEEGDLEAMAQTGLLEFGVWGDAMPVFFFNRMRAPEPEEMAEFSHPFEVSPGISGEGVCAVCRLGVGHEVHQGFRESPSAEGDEGHDMPSGGSVGTSE